MKLTLRARAFGKKFTLITTAYVLAVSSLTASVPFILSQKANAASTYEVSTWEGLRDALSDVSIPHITLISDISKVADNQYVVGNSFLGRDDTLVVSRPVIIDGLDHTISLTGDAAGWQANYVLQAFNTTGLTLHSLRLEGGDAGLLVNGSAVTLTGNNHVTGNEFGGIELGKGSGVVAQPSLTMPDGQLFGLWNYGETQFKPTVWADEAQTGGLQSVNVEGLYKATTAPADKRAYYSNFGYSGQTLAAPQSLSPQNGGIVWNNKVIDFSWKSVSNATQYEVRYSASPARVGGTNNGELNGSDAVNLTRTSTTSQTIEVPSYGNWFWQVRAINGNVVSEWSNIWSTVRAKSDFVTATPDNLRGWVLSGTEGGQATLNSVNSPVSGVGALRLVSNVNTSARANATLLQDFKFQDIYSLSYKTRKNSSPTLEGSAAYRVQIDADGNLATTTDRATLVHEPYWQNNGNPDPAPVTVGEWQTWDVKNGLFWASIPSVNIVPGLTNGAGGPPLYTYSQVAALLPNAKVISISTGIGSNNPNYNIDVDAITVGSRINGAPSVVTYDFEPDTVSPVATLNSIGSTVRGTVNIAGSVTDNYNLAHYNLSLYNGSVDLSDGETHSSARIALPGWSTSGQTNVSGTSESVSRDLDTTQLDDGVYQVRLAVRDAAGNRGAESVKYFSFIVDNTDPEVTLDASSFATNRPTLTGTVNDPNATIYLVIDGESPVEAINNGDGTWSYRVPEPLANGSYAIEVYARDAIGNVSEVSATGQIVIATTIVVPGGTGVVPEVENSTDSEQTTTGTVTVTTPAITNPSGLAAILGAGDGNTDTDDADVEGISTANTLAAAVDNTDGKAFGLAWYWWLLIIAAVAGAIWWIVGAVRARQAE